MGTKERELKQAEEFGAESQAIQQMGSVAGVVVHLKKRYWMLRRRGC